MRNLLKGSDAITGMDLNVFLRDYEPQLRNVRCLYVIQPMMERSAITKFGIAGELYGNAYKRLRDYQIEYGDATKKNDCKGTWIYYCGITKYNPYVLPANTEVRKTETYLKRLFKSKLEKKRGTERVKVSPQKVIEVIQSIRFKDAVKDEVRRQEFKTLSRLRTTKETLPLNAVTRLRSPRMYSPTPQELFKSTSFVE